MSKNLYGFTNEPTAHFSFQPPSSQRVKHEAGWAAPGFSDLVNSFSQADGRTSYSTQTVHDVKITLYNNKVDNVSKSLQSGHLMFIDTEKGQQKPISVQYLNCLLSFEKAEELDPRVILDRYKFLGLVVAEDHENRGVVSQRIVHRQTFTVGIQGTFSIFNYWYQVDAKKYSDCFLILKKVTFKEAFKIRYGDDMNGERSVEAGTYWQVMPYAHEKGKVPPLDQYIDGWYWYIGNIHEYMDMTHITSGPSPVHNYDELIHFNGSMPVQFYLNSA